MKIDKVMLLKYQSPITKAGCNEGSTKPVAISDWLHSNWKGIL